MQLLTVGLLSVLMAVLPAMLLPTPADDHIVVYIDRTEIQPEEITLQTDAGGIDILIDEYLVGVVLAEMPTSFSDEALKAQAVAARTVARHRMSHKKHNNADLCSNSSCCQAWIDPYEYLKQTNQQVKGYERVKSAVAETKNEVLLYDGELIEALYFSCSGGATEDAVAVWGNDVPYLVSVESEGEESAEKYHEIVRIDENEFWETICGEEGWNDFCPTGGGNELGKITYTNGGGVATLKIGNRQIEGTKLRSLFHLNSTRFTVCAENGEIVFQVYGYGHRVGMSQYGANAMAEAGSDYIEILEHYYSGAKVAKQKNTAVKS